MSEATEVTSPINPLVEYSYSYGPLNLQKNSISRYISEVRGKVAPFRFQLAAREISKELQLMPGNKILELGSGLGLLGNAIKSDSLRVSFALLTYP